MPPLSLIRSAYLGSTYPEGSAERTEYHELAAALFERIVQHPEARFKDIQWAAKTIHSFGTTYPEGSAGRTKYHQKAATLHELPINYPPATLDNIRRAANKLHSHGYLARAAALFRKLVRSN